jgi:hypothetical protein
MRRKNDMAKDRVPTQAERVLGYIKDFGSITRAEAMYDIGVANLTAVITSLRKSGHDIETKEIKAKNRYGQNITYAKYVFGEDEKLEVNRYAN